MGVSKYRGTPKSSHFNRIFHYKPSILGVLPLFLETPIYRTGNFGVPKLGSFTRRILLVLGLERWNFRAVNYNLGWNYPPPRMPVY